MRKEPISTSADSKLLPPPFYLCLFVGLSVYLLAGLLKKLQTDVDEFSGRGGALTRVNSRLDFGGA